MKIRFAHGLMILVLVISTGCNLPRPSATTVAKNVIPNTSQPPIETPAPSPTPETELSPTGFVDVYEQNVAAGKWTREQGLVTMLQALSGEIEATQAGIPAKLSSREGTGIVSMARDYINKGSDEATKKELGRLINMLVPDEEKIKKYARLQNAGYLNSKLLAAPIAQTAQNCVALWTNGFPDDATTNLQCFLYGEHTVHGVQFRVYKPAEPTDAPGEYFGAAENAVADSINAYSGYGRLGPIYVVFSPLPAGINDALAVTGIIGYSSQSCPIIVYQSATHDPIPVFKQTIAHEVFHCFQSLNLATQVSGPGYDPAEWWIEGSAEYFANTVYPAVDNEYENYLGDLLTNSQYKQIVELSYENFLFFMYLGGRSSPASVIDFLRGMATEGDVNLQISTLSEYPDIHNIYEGYVQAFLDNTIQDTSGRIYPYTLTYRDSVTINRATSYEMRTKPFMLTRYVYKFMTHTQYNNIWTPDSTDISGEAKIAGTTNAWLALPANVDAGCREVSYVVYVFSTAGYYNQIYKTTLNDAAVEKQCDLCVVGTWDLDNQSYASYFDSLMSNVPNVTFKEATGRMFATFTEAGEFTGGYENFQISYDQDVSNLGGQSVNVEGVLTFNGTGTAEYTVTDSELVMSNNQMNVDISLQLLVNGILVTTPTDSLPQNISGGPFGGSQAYSCNGDTLQIIPHLEGYTISPLIFHRVAP